MTDGRELRSRFTEKSHAYGHLRHESKTRYQHDTDTVHNAFGNYCTKGLRQGENLIWAKNAKTRNNAYTGN